MSYWIALTHSWKPYQPVALDGWTFWGIIRRENGEMGAMRSLDQAEVQRALRLKEKED